MDALDIKDFCNPSDWRPAYQRPFNFEGRTIATNGHALLSMPEQEGVNELDGPIGEGIKRILSQFGPATFIPVPDDIEMPPSVECPECKGTKKTTVKICPECDGEGEVDAETDYSTYSGLECQSCKGEGKAIAPGEGEDCGRCLGAGEIYPPHAPIAIGGMHVNACILKKIMGAEDLVIAPSPENYTLLFKSGDCEGVLMGMKI